MTFGADKHSGGRSLARLCVATRGGPMPSKPVQCRLSASLARGWGRGEHSTQHSFLQFRGSRNPSPPTGQAKQAFPGAAVNAGLACPQQGFQAAAGDPNPGPRSTTEAECGLAAEPPPGPGPRNVGGPGGEAARRGRFLCPREGSRRGARGAHCCPLPTTRPSGRGRGPRRRAARGRGARQRWAGRAGGSDEYSEGEGSGGRERSPRLPAAPAA